MITWLWESKKIKHFYLNCSQKLYDWGILQEFWSESRLADDSGILLGKEFWSRRNLSVLKSACRNSNARLQRKKIDGDGT